MLYVCMVRTYSVHTSVHASAPKHAKPINQHSIIHFPSCCLELGKKAPFTSYNSYLPALHDLQASLETVYCTVLAITPA